MALSFVVSDTRSTTGESVFVISAFNGLRLLSVEWRIPAPSAPYLPVPGSHPLFSPEVVVNQWNAGQIWATLNGTAYLRSVGVPVEDMVGYNPQNDSIPLINPIAKAEYDGGVTPPPPPTAKLILELEGATQNGNTITAEGEFKMFVAGQNLSQAINNVEFILDNNEIHRSEFVAPFSLFANDGYGTISTGTHTLTVIAKSGALELKRETYVIVSRQGGQQIEHVIRVKYHNLLGAGDILAQQVDAQSYRIQAILPTNFTYLYSSVNTDENYIDIVIHEYGNNLLPLPIILAIVAIVVLVIGLIFYAGFSYSENGTLKNTVETGQACRDEINGVILDETLSSDEKVQKINEILLKCNTTPPPPDNGLFYVALGLAALVLLEKK